MKTKTTMYKLLAFINLFGLMHAQPYSNYLDSTVRWHWKGGSGDGINYYHTWFNYYVNGDTVINSKAYFKVAFLKKDSTVHLMFPGPPTIVVNSYPYSYAIREDSTKKFYAFYQGDLQETLIADFNLTVGDTFPNTNPGCSIGIHDTIVGLKRWKHLVNSFGNGVLEGIGVTAPLCATGVEGDLHLTCFYKNGNSLILDTANACYKIKIPEVVTSMREDKLEAISVYPNPAKDYLVVDNFGDKKQYHITIIDCLGKRALQSNSISLPHKLDINYIDDGIYIIEIRSGNNVLRKKFIKGSSI